VIQSAARAAVHGHYAAMAQTHGHQTLTADGNAEMRDLKLCHCIECRIWDVPSPVILHRIQRKLIATPTIVANEIVLGSCIELVVHPTGLHQQPTT
jgi:hypothetical protein